MPSTDEFFGGSAAEQVEGGLLPASPAVEGGSAGDPELQAAPEPEPVQFTSLTPSGIEVLYQASPKRLYRVRDADADREDGGEERWVEVPSVTTVLKCLDKSAALTWWAMKVGVDGVAALANRGLVRVGLRDKFGNHPLIVPGGAGTMVPANAETVVPLLTENKLTVNHVLSDAGDRGQSAHDALEAWIETSRLPNPEVYDEDERGYVAGLRKFLELLPETARESSESEVTVGSLEHGLAGRYDWRLELENDLEGVVVKTYPKRADKLGTIPAGRHLWDLKTSKYVYTPHFLQLEAYEALSVECGYEPTDYRGVVHITADGRYEIVLNPGTWTFEDYLAIKAAYHVTARKGWK